MGIRLGHFVDQLEFEYHSKRNLECLNVDFKLVLQKQVIAANQTMSFDLIRPEFHQVFSSIADSISRLHGLNIILQLFRHHSSTLDLDCIVEWGLLVKVSYFFVQCIYHKLTLTHLYPLLLSSIPILAYNSNNMDSIKIYYLNRYHVLFAKNDWQLEC